MSNKVVQKQALIFKAKRYLTKLQDTDDEEFDELRHRCDKVREKIYKTPLGKDRDFEHFCTNQVMDLSVYINSLFEGENAQEFATLIKEMTDFGQ